MIKNKPKMKVYVTSAPNRKNKNPMIEYVRDRTRKNKNFLAVWVGETGSGKTYSALQFAHQLDPRFTADDVVFTIEDFFSLLTKYQKLYAINPRLVRGRVIIFDEAGVGMNNRQWASYANKAITAVMQSFRYMNLVVLFTTPDMTFVDAAARRLFHGYFEALKDGIDYKNKIACSKYFTFVRDVYKGTAFPMYLRVYDKESKTVKRLTRVCFRLAPDWLIDSYEAKRHKWASERYAQMTKGIKLTLEGYKVSISSEGKAMKKRKSVVDYNEVKKMFMANPGLYMKMTKTGKVKIDDGLLRGTGKFKGASASLKLAVKKMYYDKDVQEIFERVKAGEIPLVNI